MGWSYSCQTRTLACSQYWPIWEWHAPRSHTLSLIRQCRYCHSSEQGLLLQSQNQQGSQTHLCTAGPAPDPSKIHLCPKLHQHLWCIIMRCHQQVPGRFPFNQYSCLSTIAIPLSRQVIITVAPVSVIPSHSLPIESHQQTLISAQLQLNPSSLWPNCHAGEHIFQWRGVNTPPASMISHPAILLIASLASWASPQDSSSYGSGI